MWVEYKLHKDGSIKSEKVVSASKESGCYVRYVEANTLEEARAKVKSWWKSSHEKRAKRLAEQGMCDGCARFRRDADSMYCKKCKAKRARESRERRAGTYVYQEPEKRREVSATNLVKAREAARQVTTKPLSDLIPTSRALVVRVCKAALAAPDPVAWLHDTIEQCSPKAEAAE
jgi:hypothetical protein